MSSAVCPIACTAGSTPDMRRPLRILAALLALAGLLTVAPAALARTTVLSGVVQLQHADAKTPGGPARYLYSLRTTKGSVALRLAGPKSLTPGSYVHVRGTRRGGLLRVTGVAPREAAQRRRPPSRGPRAVHGQGGAGIAAAGRRADQLLRQHEPAVHAHGDRELAVQQPVQRRGVLRRAVARQDDADRHRVRLVHARHAAGRLRRATSRTGRRWRGPRSAAPSTGTATSCTSGRRCPPPTAAGRVSATCRAARRGSTATPSCA